MQKNRRYPGVNFFREGDKHIFCGREEDSQQLFNQLYINETVVLHAKSGIGKSSLIRAGLLPLIKKYNLNSKLKKSLSQILPVIINWGISTTQNNDNKILVEKVIESIKTKVYKSKIEIANLPLLKRQNELWYLVKQLQLANYNLLLIFDQFEEIESYPRKQIDFFSQELAKLFLLGLPNKQNIELVNEVKKRDKGSSELNNQILLLEKRLDCSVLFVVREDKLGVLSQLKKNIPNILKIDYLLFPLTVKNAKKAITLPSQAEGNYKTPKFKINQNVVNQIIREIKDQETQLVDPFEIQIICSALESKITESKKVIGIRDLDSIDDILGEFKDKIWNEIANELYIEDSTFENTKMAILEKLVVNGKRASVLKDSFSSEQFGKKIVEKLWEKGFLNKSIRGENSFFEIAHDRLIEAITPDLNNFIAQKKSKEKIEKNLKKVKIISWISIFLLIFIGLVSYFVIGKERANQEKILVAAQTKKAEYPEFSYQLARNYYEEHKKGPFHWIFSLKDIKKFMDGFDKLKVSYRSERIPIQEKLFDVSLVSRDSMERIMIKTKYKSQLWGLNPTHLISSTENDYLPIYRKETANGLISVKQISADSVDVQNSDGSSMQKFEIHNTDLSSNDIDVSRDGKRIIIKYSAYSLDNGNLIGELANIPSMRDQMVSKFLNNGKYLAVGYWSGYVIIFDLSQKNDENFFKIHQILKPQSGINTIVKSLVIESSNKYLYAGDGSGNINKYQISDTKQLGSTPPTEIFYIHNDEINCLSLSKNDSIIISGSKDQNAVVWESHTGNIISYLRGMNGEVIDTGFLNVDATQFYTLTSNYLTIWNLKKPSELYNSNTLFSYSPYEYNRLGLSNNQDWNSIYDTSNLENKYDGFLNYFSSLPSENYFLGDEDYQNLLKTALLDLESMLKNLEKEPLNRDSEMLLSRLDVELKFKLKPTLLKSPDETIISKMNRENKYFETLGTYFLEDSSDFSARDESLNGLLRISDQLIVDPRENDKHINDESLLRNLNLIEEIYNASFIKRKEAPENDIIVEYLSQFWFDLSYLFLFDNQFDLAISASEKSLELKKEQKAVYSHMILGHILCDDWTKAESLLKKHLNSVVVVEEESMNFNVLIGSDIQQLRKHGIDHQDFEKVFELINR